MIEARLYQVPPQASQVTAASSTIDPPDWVLGPSHIVTSLPPPRGGVWEMSPNRLSPTPSGPRSQLPKSQLHAYSVGRVTKSTLLIALRARASSKSQCPSVSYKSGNSQPLERVKPLLISILNRHPLHTLVSHPHAHSHPLNTPFFSSPCTSSHPLSHHSEFPFQPPRPPPRTSSILWLPLYTASTPLNTNGKYCFSTPSPIVSIKSTYLLSQDTHFFLRPCITQGLSNQTSIFPN